MVVFFALYRRIRAAAVFCRHHPWQPQRVRRRRSEGGACFQSGWSIFPPLPVLRQNLVTVDTIDFLQPTAPLSWHQGITIFALTVRTNEIEILRFANH